MIDNITGIILAGGKSTRMGVDKAFLKIGERTVIEEIFSRFENIFSRIIIVANEIEKFNFLGAQITSDIVPSKGPLGGIYTGLIKSNSFYNFVTACDMPFLRQDVVEYILGQRSGWDVIVPEYRGRLEPLCAVYSKNCIKPIENQLGQNNLKIRSFFQYVRAKTLVEQEISQFAPEGICFANINTVQDYEQFRYSQTPK
jgi:molybdopterin-guanine dinucleotide biosynthesis protein A